MIRVEFVVEGDPSDGRINGRSEVRRTGRGRGDVRIGKSDRYQGYLERVAAAALACRRRTGVAIRGGAVGLAVVWYFPREVDPNNRKRKTPLPDVPVGLANTDADAPIKCLFDGIAAGGLFDCDVRIVDYHVRKRVDRVRPRAAVAVWTIANIDG